MAFDVMVPFRDELRAARRRQRRPGRRPDRRRARRSAPAPTRAASAAGCPTRRADRRRRSRCARWSCSTTSSLTLRRLHQPVIAAVNGPAIGGGLCLALACDVRVAAESAYFRAAGINNGLTASELGLSYLLPRAIGSSRAFEIMLTGRDVDADEAAQIGLVSRVVPDDQLLDSASRPPPTSPRWSRPGVELTKRTLRSASTPPASSSTCTPRGSVSCSCG